MNFKKYAVLFIIVLSTVLSLNCSKQNDDSIKIGGLLPLSGDAAAYGQSAKQGIELALKEVDVKVNIIYEDSKASPNEGVSAFQKLINVDKVLAIVGPMASSVTLAIAPIANNDSIVVLSPASSNPKVTHAGDFIFRNDVSDIFDGQMMAKAAWNRLGIKKAALLIINNDYGIGIKDIFVKHFNELGGKTTAVEIFKQNENDFRTQLLRIKKSEPDAIYVVGYKEQIPIYKQYKELGLKMQILAPAMLQDKEIIEKVGDIVEGAIYTSRTYDINSEKDIVKEFVKKFELEYGKEPDNWAAQSYDAMKILVLAIKNSNKTSNGIKNALYNIKSFPGVSGETTFDENGDVVKPMDLKIIKNGKFLHYSENK